MRRTTLVHIGDVIADLWREEIRRHWPFRQSSWRREMIRQYLMLVRLREDKRPERVISLYRKSRET